MTRRVRFTPLSCARTLLAVGIASAGWLAAGAAGASEVPFGPASVISSLTDPGAVASGDVDGDGDADLLAGWNTPARMAWFENANGDGSVWTLRTIATNMIGIRSVAAADVDGDGDLDAVASSATSDAVVWYENTAGNGSAWAVRTISTAVDVAWTISTADVDGDGDTDVLSANAVSPDGAVYFHENTAGDGSAWMSRTIFAGTQFVSSVSAADVDGDGDQDVVAASLNDTTLAWHENLAGDGTTWVMRTITTMGQAMDSVPADVDRDGDVDVVATFYYTSTVGWYENVIGNGQVWMLHTIATTVPSAIGLVAGDLDGDGDVDAVSTSATGDAVLWHENLDTQASAWMTRTVGVTGPVPQEVVMADLDGDGDLDLASVSPLGNEIAWFRNESIHQTACFGPVRTIFAMDFPFGSAAADVDRDGDLDVFATSFVPDSDLTWHRNDGGGAAWTAFTVATNRGTFFANVADVDGDGDSDAFIGSDVNNPAAWVDNPGGGSAWPIHAIGTPGDFTSRDLIGADLDGDGDADALARADNSGLLSWWENTDGQGLVWLRHTVATFTNGAGAWPVDLDRDGDLDILVPQTANSGGPAPLTWYENVAGDGGTWTTHTISATADDIEALALDLDSDGDLDVVGSNVTSSPGISWHENLSGNGTSWATHTLSTLLRLVSIESRDVDQDGDQDLVGSGGPLGPVWLERTGSGVSFTQRTVATNAGVPGQVTTADLDGDGAPDLLWASQLGDAVVWNRNGRGQVVLDLLDQVPATVNNNDVFPVLRLTVTHGGRAGDSDLELARLGLLFEEEPGDPLTSAEANALVEELRVYRDANGNGTFDPGIDTLVATIRTLALTAGVQTAAFADGDPNVQVAFGTPRTFFVVAQLTGNASQQVPHQFRMTHLALGPAATLAEDRSADIPLTIACPADFASRLIVATPVELMGFTIE